jgi:hypothetical protein
MAEQRPDEESEALRAFRAAFEEANRAWNEGDFKRAYAGLPDDVEYRLTAAWPRARPLKGRDEVIAFFEDLRETFPDLKAPLLEVIAVNDRTTVVGFEVIGTGRTSGVGTKMEIWQVWELDEAGTLFRVTEFHDRSEALETGGTVPAANGETS